MAQPLSAWFERMICVVVIEPRTQRLSCERSKRPFAGGTRKHPKGEIRTMSRLFCENAKKEHVSYMSKWQRLSCPWSFGRGSSARKSYHKLPRAQKQRLYTFHKTLYDCQPIISMGQGTTSTEENLLDCCCRDGERGTKRLDAVFAGTMGAVLLSSVAG